MIDCFNPNKGFSNFLPFLSPFKQQHWWLFHMHFFLLPCKKAFFTSNSCKAQLYETSREMRSQIEVIVATREMSLKHQHHKSDYNLWLLRWPSSHQLIHQGSLYGVKPTTSNSRLLKRKLYRIPSIILCMQAILPPLLHSIKNELMPHRFLDDMFDKKDR